MQTARCFFKGGICRDNHQGVVHDFDCVRAKLFPGQLVAGDAACKSLLIFKVLALFVRRAEVVKKRNRDAVCRFARQEVHEFFKRMPQLCAHIFILSVQYCRRYPARMEVFHSHAPFPFCPTLGGTGAVRGAAGVLSPSDACALCPTEAAPMQKPRAERRGAFLCWLAAYTSSMMAISAASPRRTPVFTMRV